MHKACQDQVKDRLRFGVLKSRNAKYLDIVKVAPRCTDEKSLGGVRSCYGANIYYESGRLPTDLSRRGASEWRDYSDLQIR